MPPYYIYLISSLPMLRFGAGPPFSFKELLQICQEFIAQEDLKVLKSASISGEYDYTNTTSPALKKWQDFDAALRNELVRVRAARKHLDPERYLRRERYAEPSISHMAMAAYRNPSILEGEKMLDEQRWRILETLAVGHYFDLDFLILYALKLLILERWQRINSADKSDAVEGILQESKT